MTYSGSQPEKNDGYNMTEPDQVMSVREILARSLEGKRHRGSAGEPEYYGDLEVPNLGALTNVQKQEMAIAEREKSLELEEEGNRLAEEMQGRKAKARKEEMAKAFEELQTKKPVTGDEG